MMRAKRAQPEETPTRLVVVEDRAHLKADFLLDSRTDGEDGESVTVLVQDHDSARRLAARTMQRLASVERTGKRLTQAVVVVGSDKDASALAARCVLVRVLLAHLVRAGAGEVVLAAEGDTDSELRHQLLALAGTLAGEVGSSGVTIRVRFGQDAPPLARASARRAPVPSAEYALA